MITQYPFIQKNKVLSNIYDNLNHIELYLDKRNSIYDNMFDPILEDIETFNSYTSDNEKSLEPPVKGTGENSIRHFLTQIHCIIEKFM